MKRVALLAFAFVVGTASLMEAQVIGTYRPSVVTYYPSATSVAPATAYRPLPSATQFASTQYTYPVTTVGSPQVFSSTPVVNTSYVSTTPYVTASPIVGGNCNCSPVQTVGGISYQPITNYSPPVQTVAYQQPIQTVAYQQPATLPVQTVSAQTAAVGGKYYVGKGLLGRPKVYAQGQPVRNALRSIFP